MLKNYLVIALRNARRNIGLSLIQVIGLSASMAVGLLVLHVVRVHDAFDEFHPHSDRLYRIYSHYTSPANDYPGTYGTAPATLAQRLRQDVPGIESVVHLERLYRKVIRADGAGLSTHGIFAPPEFLELFAFPLQQGDTRTALARPGQVVLSDRMASRLFGEQSPLGRTVTVESVGELEVSGLIEAQSQRSHIPHDVIVSMATLPSTEHGAWVTQHWSHGLAHSFTFARIAAGAEAQIVQQRIDEMVANGFPDAGGSILHHLVMEPIGAINLSSVNKGNDIGEPVSMRVVVSLGGLAALTLLMAGVNYWSLAVARASRRSREVGVRKAVGARRGAVATQFMIEAAAHVAVALLLASVGLHLLLDEFNALSVVQDTGLAVDAAIWSAPASYAIVIAFGLLVALGAGLYPAIHLSRFGAADIVRSGARSHIGGLPVRRALTVVQFALSLIIAVTAATMSSQLGFLSGIDYGLRRDSVVNVRLHDVPADVLTSYAASLPGVRTVAPVSVLPALSSREDKWLSPTADGETFEGYRYRVDAQFVEVFGLKLLAGRNLPDGVGPDDPLVLINERALRGFGFDSPAAAVGQTIYWGRTNDMHAAQVVGVVGNFQSNSIDMSPASVVLTPGHQFGWLSLLTAPGHSETILAQLRDEWPKLSSAPFDGHLYADQIDNSEELVLLRDVVTMVRFIAALALGIACLGLLGMAAHSAEARIKEVGIRRAIGAGLGHLLYTLSREHITLVVLGTVLALPVAIWLSISWLEVYPMRADISVPYVGTACGLLILMALITVGSQTLRAALANPLASLRQE